VPIISNSASLVETLKVDLELNSRETPAKIPLADLRSRRHVARLDNRARANVDTVHVSLDNLAGGTEEGRLWILLQLQSLKQVPSTGPCLIKLPRPRQYDIPLGADGRASARLRAAEGLRVICGPVTKNISPCT